MMASILPRFAAAFLVSAASSVHSAAEAVCLEDDGDPRSLDIANRFWRRTQHKRTVYFCPIEGFGNMMVSIAAVLKTVRQLDVNVKFVYSNKLYWEFAGSWDDYFSEPDLLLAPFPGCEDEDDCWMPTDRASCSMVSDSDDLMATLKDSSSWERQKDGSEAFCFIGGVRSYGVSEAARLPYYRMLKPSSSVAKRLQEVKESIRYDQEDIMWIGVHARRSDIFQHPLFDVWWKDHGVNQWAKDFNASAHEVPHSWQVDRFIDAMNAIGLTALFPRDHIRFYLSTDDEHAARRIIHSFPSPDSPRVAKVVTAPKNLGQDPRGTVQGQIDAFVDMWMLASCRLVIGSAGSTFSLTAKRMGNNFLLPLGCYHQHCMHERNPEAW